MSNNLHKPYPDIGSESKSHAADSRVILGCRVNFNRDVDSLHDVPDCGRESDV